MQIFEVSGKFIIPGTRKLANVSRKAMGDDGKLHDAGPLRIIARDLDHAVSDLIGGLMAEKEIKRNMKEGFVLTPTLLKSCLRIQPLSV